MSSDTFHIHLLSIEGDAAELLCTTSTAGGINDYAVTRSFALMALEDGMGYGAKTPLQQGVAGLGGQVWEDSFHREHVGKFIAKTEIVRRIGIVGDEAAWRQGRFSEEDGGANVERDFPLHKFILRVQVTDPKYLEGLEVGASWGTTAYDAWWDDPLRPSKAAMAAVDRAATYWKPAGTTKAPRAAKSTAKRGVKKAAKATAKRTVKKTTAKKATAKKAAKKTTAKKAAKKTTAKKATAKKATAKKTTAKKAAKKATAKKAAKKTTAKKAAKKTTAKKAAKTAARG